jgi:hypothetical protein
MREIGHNSSSSIVSNVINELHDTNSLKCMASYAKLHCLVSFSGYFSLCMREIGRNSTSRINLNIINELSYPDFV